MEDIYEGIVNSLVGRIYQSKKEPKNLYRYSSHSDTKFVFRNQKNNVPPHTKVCGL